MTHTPPPQGGQYQGGQYQGGQYQGGQYQDGQYEDGGAQPAQPPGATPSAVPQQPAYQQPPQQYGNPPQQPAYQQPPAQYAAPQQPYQQPPQQYGSPQQAPGGQQYGPPPQYPGGGGIPPAAGAPPAKGRGKLFGAIGSVGGIGILITLILVAVRIFGGGGDDVPSVGECMTDALNPTLMQVVDCDADNAYWVVIGLDGSMASQAFDNATEDDVCQNFPEWENALWFGPDDDNPSSRGDIVCLTQVGSPAP